MDPRPRNVNAQGVIIIKDPHLLVTPQSEDVGPWVEMTETWEGLMEAIPEAVLDAAADSPSYDDDSWQPFQTYWHSVFERFRDSVSRDDSIPMYLTNPPVNKIKITLFDAPPRRGCPCCHDDPEPGSVAEIENDSGVTKIDFINFIIKEFFEDFTPWVNIESEPMFDLPTDVETNDGLVIHDSSWMSTIDENGQPTVYEYFTFEGAPHIILYCCTPEDCRVAKQMKADWKPSDAYVDEEEEEEEEEDDDDEDEDEEYEREERRGRRRRRLSPWVSRFSS